MVIARRVLLCGGAAFLSHQPVAAFSPAPAPFWSQRLAPTARAPIVLATVQGGSTAASFTTRPEKPPPADGSEKPKKRHALLTFGFCGTNYYGLQSQSAAGDPDLPTISDVLRKALLDTGFIAPSNFAPLARTKWTLASRTDKGVHAACAAASVKLETRSADIVGQRALEEMGDPAALEHAAVLASRDDDGKRTGADAADGEWQLSDSALARINAALPDDVVVFSGTRVRGKFDARVQAASRVYEYLMPVDAVLPVDGSIERGIARFDESLRGFEGTHRMHNFAAGLRRSHAEAGAYTTDEGDQWPLGLDPGTHTTSAYRSVITCRVFRRVTICGADYLVLRIAGLAFVLHQIRHMVGAALAVANDAVPADALDIARNTPLRLDVAPLVPGTGLYLDEISWFDVKRGGYEARVPGRARDAMEAFKLREIYPHIHRIYAEEGTYTTIVRDLRAGGRRETGDTIVPIGGYRAEDYARLRRVSACWREEVKVLAERRREARRRRREELDAADQAEGRPPRKPREPPSVPGGMMVVLCKAHQIMPGAETHRALEYLKAQVGRGELLAAQPYEYYLDALEERAPELAAALARGSHAHQQGASSPAA